MTEWITHMDCIYLYMYVLSIWFYNLLFLLTTYHIAWTSSHANMDRLTMIFLTAPYYIIQIYWNLFNQSHVDSYLGYFCFSPGFFSKVTINNLYISLCNFMWTSIGYINKSEVSELKNLYAYNLFMPLPAQLQIIKSVSNKPLRLFSMHCFECMLQRVDFLFPLHSFLMQFLRTCLLTDMNSIQKPMDKNQRLQSLKQYLKGH